MEELRKKRKQQRAKLKSDSKIKECFHFDKESCEGKIKDAHSLQKNGVLSLLEYEINKNKVVYSFSHRRLSGPMSFNGFESLGKKECSTFHGFCDYHDSIVFAPIENSEVNVQSDEHCFLLCYRAFAKEYHAKIEANKGFENNEIYNQPQNKQMREEMLKGSELAIRDLKNVKNRLNSILENKNYSDLDYFIYTLPYSVPIACAASITPSYSYSGILLNKSEDFNDVYENIMVTVLPTLRQTHIIMGCFSDDKRSITYIDELENLSEKKLENAITSILIGDIENAFFSPLLWKRMVKRERELLMNEISLTSPFSLSMIEEGFFLSRLNLFNMKYVNKE
ncbi:hypothetical protein [Arcticibacterium luteifluviistationis]|uniref:Uncharacterized protein n=1 Tax=Arcticibacterium luteifluviistationis TaxID=1784714 RepID=A0A2Z4GHH9_9BACT|nr:hypothetical protein [Arcticibacterium luteifluviistationis]AWW00717.1 hypothetical protein DJ013_22015 [Arcticibacterium luteifluviistationis]